MNVVREESSTEISNLIISFYLKILSLGYFFIFIIIIKYSTLIDGFVGEMKQICDFGLSKWLPKHWSHHNATKFEGTFGCVGAVFYFSYNYYYNYS